MGKIFIKTTKKLTALGLALVLLFNISGEVFAYTLTAREKIIEQRDLSSQITSILETAKTEIYSGEKDYKECVEKGVSSSCLRYINNLKRILSDSESKIEGNNSVVESKKTYKEYEQEVKQAIEKEYKRAEEEIEKEIREALWYSDLSWESVNHLNYLKKQNLEELKAWKENEEKNIKSGYGKYEKDYQVWQNKTQTSLEAQGRSYLRKMASNLIAIYEGNKGSEFNDDIIEILSAPLNSEEKAGDFVENRLKAEEILLKGLQGDPCAYNAQGKQLNKTGELLTNLALINRNIYSSGATPVVLNEGAWDIIPATYKNPQKCQNAFYTLEGLSHLKRSEKGIKVILDFIKKNEKGLAASDKFNNSLVSSSAVLLKWKAYPQLKKYIAAKMQEEKNNEQTGFGAIAGKVAYNGNYLGQISMYNQREDGGNAWEDLAELLAEEGSFESKEILKSSVNSCKIEKE
ncbi:MAG: hypothetical protein II972_00365, partial [Elusimicrobiaceae bacterium]|nr:hypothetical protein [Elusimicrobiaceae bacterium]